MTFAPLAMRPFTAISLLFVRLYHLGLLAMKHRLPEIAALPATPKSGQLAFWPAP
jgi:hypothetical protein